MKPKSCIYMNDVGCVIKIDQQDGCPCERGRRETRYKFQADVLNKFCAGEMTVEQVRDKVNEFERVWINGGEV